MRTFICSILLLSVAHVSPVFAFFDDYSFITFGEYLENSSDTIIGCENYPHKDYLFEPPKINAYYLSKALAASSIAKKFYAIKPKYTIKCYQHGSIFFTTSYEVNIFEDIEMDNLYYPYGYNGGYASPLFSLSSEHTLGTISISRHNSVEIEIHHSFTPEDEVIISNLSYVNWKMQGARERFTSKPIDLTQ